jgi:hypothetical protein
MIERNHDYLNCKKLKQKQKTHVNNAEILIKDLHIINDQYIDLDYFIFFT